MLYLSYWINTAFLEKWKYLVSFIWRIFSGFGESWRIIPNVVFWGNPQYSKAIILGRKSFRLLASKTKGREQNWSLVSFTAAYIYSSTKLIALNVSIITFLVYLYNFKMDIISTLLSYIIGFIREYDLGWIFCNQCNKHIENILFSCCNYKSM